MHGCQAHLLRGLQEGLQGPARKIHAVCRNPQLQDQRVQCERPLPRSIPRFGALPSTPTPHLGSGGLALVLSLPSHSQACFPGSLYLLLHLCQSHSPWGLVWPWARTHG